MHVALKVVAGLGLAGLIYLQLLQDYQTEEIPKKAAQAQLRADVNAAGSCLVYATTIDKKAAECEVAGHPIDPKWFSKASASSDQARACQVSRPAFISDAEKQTMCKRTITDMECGLFNKGGWLNDTACI